MPHNITFGNLVAPRFAGESKWKSLARTVIGCFAVIVLSFFLAGRVVASADATIVFFFSALFLVMALNNEFHGYVIALILAFYSSYLVYLLSLGSLYLMLPYIVVLGLFARRLIATLLHVSIVRSPLYTPLLCLSIFILVSLVLNGSKFEPALKGVIKHISIILFFFVVANSRLSESSLKKLIGLIVIIGFAQIPASIFQYYVVYANYVPGARADLSAGLLGFSSGAVNAVFITFIMSLIFGFIVDFGPRFKYLVGAVLLPITTILSSARAGLLFCVITLLFQTALVPFVQSRKRLHRLVISVMTVVLVGGGGFLMAKPDQISFIANPTAMYEYSAQRADSGLGRLQALEFVHNSISKDFFKSLVGYGPGAITPTKFLGGDRSDLLQENRLGDYNDYTYITLELGYGGLFLNLYLLYRLFIFNRRFHARCQDKFWRAVSLGLGGIIFTAIYSIVYTRGWTYPPLAFSLWFIAGAITRIAYLRGLLTNPNVPSAIRLAG
jgi:hypothetical protein